MSLIQFAMIMWAIILVAEILSGRHRQVHRTRDWLITAGCFLTLQMTRPVAAILVATVFGLLLPAGQGALAHLPLWPSVLVLLLVSEFVFYWIHRWAHDPVRHKILYGLHRTHHSAPYLNLVVMMRLNPFWVFVVGNSWTVGLALYLGQGAAGAIVMGITIAWNVLTHSDFRFDDLLVKTAWGKRVVNALEWVFITPRLHHTHHGYGKDGKNYRNFATVLSIWDRMFGTLHIPEGRPARYGLPGDDKHWSEEVFFPLLRRR